MAPVGEFSESATKLMSITDKNMKLVNIGPMKGPLRLDQIIVVLDILTKLHNLLI
jgi:hypothetical protein